MAKKRLSGRRAAKRLLAAISAPDELTCEEVQELLPAFVEAKFAGADVASNPDYALLLKHLSRDDPCYTLYTKLMDDLEELIGEQAAPPQAQAPEAAPEPDRPAFALRVFEGLRRRFELDLAVPDLAPALAAAGGFRAGEARRESLLAEQLNGVPGAPQVAVALLVRSGPAELRVTIRERPSASRWQVRLTIGDTLHTAKTDERGVAELLDLGVADLQRLGTLTLTCVELE